VSRYAAVLLDANGTLLELDRPYVRLADALRRRGVVVSDANAERGFRVEMSHYATRCHEGRDEASLERLRADCAAVLARELGRVDTAAVAAALDEAVVFRPFADAAALLARLRERGIATAVVSNWDCSLAVTLEAAGLAVDTVVTCAGAGARKPDPAIFRRALADLGVGAEAALHIGDRAELDGAGARAAGIEVRILDRSATAPPPGTIATLTDVLGIL
jgi:putative hydrolase of the HAD superfamily